MLGRRLHSDFLSGEQCDLIAPGEVGDTFNVSDDFEVEASADILFQYSPSDTLSDVNMIRRPDMINMNLDR